MRANGDFNDAVCTSCICRFEISFAIERTIPIINYYDIDGVLSFDDNSGGVVELITLEYL